MLTRALNQDTTRICLGLNCVLAWFVLGRYLSRVTLAAHAIDWEKSAHVPVVVCFSVVVVQWATLSVNLAGALFQKGIVPTDEAVCQPFVVMCSCGVNCEYDVLARDRLIPWRVRSIIILIIIWSPFWPLRSWMDEAWANIRKWRKQKNNIRQS